MLNDKGRLFVFGCSFTKWQYPTWGDILATHLNPKEYYNYGRSGAGNFYIFHKLIEADLQFNFTEDDLVIVEWTNITRQEYFSEESSEWVTSGNIYTQNLLPVDYKIHNVINFAIRDFTLIHSAFQQFHSKTNLKFLQMLDIFTYTDQYSNDTQDNKDFLSIANRYRYLENHMYPSFYKVLWDNDIEKNKDNSLGDWHPSIKEHAEYIQTVFNIEFSDSLKQTIEESHSDYVDIIVEHLKTNKQIDRIAIHNATFARFRTDQHTMSERLDSYNYDQ